MPNNELDSNLLAVEASLGVIRQHASLIESALDGLQAREDLPDQKSIEIRGYNFTLDQLDFLLERDANLADDVKNLTKEITKLEADNKALSREASWLKGKSNYWIRRASSRLEWLHREIPFTKTPTGEPSSVIDPIAYRVSRSLDDLSILSSCLSTSKRESKKENAFMGQCTPL